MTETTKLTKVNWKLPCPLYEEGFSGKCEDCVQRPECIMLTILRKVEHIQAKVDTILSGQF